MTHVREINDIAELSQYRLLWKSLLAQTREAVFFQSLEWLEVAWKHYGKNRRLRVLIVYVGERPLGILPLVVQKERTKAGWVRVLTYPLDGWGSFYGSIGPNPTITFRAAMRHLRNTPRDWDLLDIRWVNRDRTDHGRTKGGMRAAGFSPAAQPWARAAIIELGDSWEDYWKSRPAKFREKLRRGYRRLCELGKLSHVRYRPAGSAMGDGDPRFDLFDDAVSIARASWQGGSTDGTTLCHPEIHDFLREAHRVAARAGCLDLNLLYVDEQPVAFAYNYHYNGRVEGLRTGFDPAFAAGSPGAVLLKMAFQDCFRLGDHTFDLGVGYLNCKRHWLTRLDTSYRYTHFPLAAPKAQLLRLKRLYNTLRIIMHPAHAVSCTGVCEGRDTWKVAPLSGSENTRISPSQRLTMA